MGGALGLISGSTKKDHGRLIEIVKLVRFGRNIFACFGKMVHRVKSMDLAWHSAWRRCHAW
jgi:hypothetical protein